MDLVGLFNRLMGRRPPSAPARVVPRLHGSGQYAFPVAGSAFYQHHLARIAGKKITESVRIQCVARLILEADNKFGPNAVAVAIQDMVVGYLPREQAPEFRTALAELDADATEADCDAIVIGGWKRPGGDEAAFAVKLDLE